MDSFTPHDYADSAFYPPTPSYNGSYNNSPFSQSSDLPDIEYSSSKDDSALGLFDHDPLAISSRDEYDPASYDGPHAHSSSLLMFDSADFLSSSSSSAQAQHVAVSLTPASMMDDMHSPNYYDHSSPASSNGAETDDRRSPASSASSHPQQHSHSHYQPQASPHLNFNSLRVDSPYIGSIAMPDPSGGSPMLKPQSPPQLLIPDQPQPPAPIINAPDGDGVGPRLQIVPATPVSGGGVVDAATQHSRSYGQPSLQPGVSYGGPVNTASSYGASTSNFVFPPTNGRDDGHGSALSLATDLRANDSFLIPPSPSRGRSKSETSLPAPVWATATTNAGSLLHQSPHMGADAFGSRGNTVNPLSLQDGSLASLAGDLEGIRPSSASALQTSFGNGGSNGAQFSFMNGGNGDNSNFLSPNVVGLIRRSNSDGRGHHKARSEDLRMYAGTNTLAPYPPTSHQEFLSTARHFLSPSEQPLLPSIRNGTGHHRRTSSGSRDRGGSPRMSPYPSPSASPAHRLEPLPNISGGSISRASSVQPPSGNGGGGNGIPKVNVTTTATAEASYRRRTNDAKFACPIPGCGSTFTRHFNLKGHMRSHNDEKPFTCKWPGCLKGFARQHDCKRHEQLHSNHRPFTCDGCKKPFARLDALNRHLRSEGGAGCAKVHDQAQENGSGSGQQQQQQQQVDQQQDTTALEEWSGTYAGAGLMM